MLLTLSYACMYWFCQIFQASLLKRIISISKRCHLESNLIPLFYFILGFTVSTNSNLRAMRNYTRKFFYSRPKQGYRLGYNRYASGSKGTVSPSSKRTKSTGVTRRTDLEHTHIQTWTPDPAGDRIFSPVSLQPNIRGGFSLCKFPGDQSFKLHEQITT